MRQVVTLGLGGLMLACTVAIAFVGAASAADPFIHGISFTEGCNSPTHIGQPYSCTWSVRNNVDDAQDTLTFAGLDDTIVTAGGPVGSGNVMTSLHFVIAAGSPTCNGIGSGTAADPFRNATLCTLPFGSRLDVQPFSFYTVQPADFNLPGHVISDASELAWHDLCDDPAHTGDTNCVANPVPAGAGSQSIVVGLPASVTTQIHDAAHGVVTTMGAGATVHDFVTVSGGAGNPVPTGSVVVDWFMNGSCAGPADSSSASTPLGPAGTVDVTSFTKTPAAGIFSFQARYLGDPVNPAYDPATGACEPLSVVDANISITPSGTNPVGSSHTFTAHVHVNEGSGAGYSNAPDGTSISFTIVSGPGSFTTPNPCTTTGGTGSCSITLVSSSVGTTVVSASTTASVGGLSLTRSTNGSGANSGPASKNWADAAVRTDVHDASHVVITTVNSGDVVHDKVFVTRVAGTPAAVPDPTGNVVFHRYATGNCGGASVDQTVALAADGTAESATFTATSDISYRADYQGDANYPARSGACEPLTVKPGAAQQLQALLNAVTGVAPGSSLAAKVKAIQAYVAANDKADACAALGAFINQVNAQKGKQLTAAQTASFIAQAVAIKATLGC